MYLGNRVDRLSHELLHPNFVSPQTYIDIIMEIRSAEFKVSNSDCRKCPEGHLPEFAFIGRSNVGKSSLINMLTGRKSLAMTSATPGKTLLINHFLINREWYLVDLPGYGYARLSKSSRQELGKIITDYILHRSQLTNLFVLIDSRIPPQNIDLEFINWLGENGIPFSIVFTKADKPNSPKILQNRQEFFQRIAEHWEELPPHFVTSSSAKSGRTELLAHMDEILEMVHKQ